ncbi:hypothetical protein AO498_05522 [Algoriphagus sanaruensis]|uniref:Uncharacterized protein n=1 Tax=Algoriphagus sanaruensis TaxID=1727163 RepID=A0A142EL56_9BACT|nr:hypothetical protein AO498_05522 [Algoriphagus sanaruensis]
MNLSSEISKNTKGCKRTGLHIVQACQIRNLRTYQTLISTSTPLGSSIFIKASTVFEELE